MWNGTSMVASAFSGRFSKWGKGNFTKVIKGKSGGIFGRRSMFLGVDMNEIR
jgi:hypothetical protein